MDLFSIWRKPLRVAPLMLLGLVQAHGVSAQTVIDDDYIYIGVEAEDHISKDERWVTTEPSTPAIEQDPDGNHSDTASGSTYLELLPDIRVTHDDPMLPPRAYWGVSGTGPHADYSVNFPEAGRYYVHVRAFSTGTEDNGIHVGLNGEWPESGERLQFCSASKRAWWWSSAQRDSGGNGSCGIQKSIWLDVPTAGQHTVNLSAREDGFEIDRFALIKDLSGNTRVCSATNISGVNCVNGSIESADGFIDLRLRLQTEVVGADPEVEAPNPTEVVAGENIILNALIENLDAFDTATEIVLSLAPVPGEWAMVSMDNRCEEVDDVFNCTLDSLHPTAPNENAPFKFTMQALVAGDVRIDGSVVGLETDDTPNNHIAATIVRVSGESLAVETQTDVKLTMQTDKGAYLVGDTVTVSASAQNLGDIAADDVEVSVSVPNGLDVNASSLPDACSAGNSPSCLFEEIASGQTQSIEIELTAELAGIFTLSSLLSADNDSTANNNFDSDTIVINNPPEEVDTPVEEEAETETENSSETEVGGSEETVTDSDTGTETETNTETNTNTGGGMESSEVEEIMTTDTEVDTGVEPISEESNEPTTSEPMNEADADDADSGSLTALFVLMLVLLYLTRLNGGHQRQSITVRK